MVIVSVAGGSQGRLGDIIFVIGIIGGLCRRWGAATSRCLFYNPPVQLDITPCFANGLPFPGSPAKLDPLVGSLA